MIFHSIPVQGAWHIEPEPKADERGHFMRVWCRQEFSHHGIVFAPLQANMAYSHRRGTMRGMHFQGGPAPEAKLVRCTRGAVYDVVVDLRPESRTYRCWHGVVLSAANGSMLFLPEGCAHGCLSLEDGAEIHYLTSATYSPAHTGGIRFDDPSIGVNWPVAVEVVSDQDRAWPLLTT